MATITIDPNFDLEIIFLLGTPPPTLTFVEHTPANGQTILHNGPHVIIRVAVGDSLALVIIDTPGQNVEVVLRQNGVDVPIVGGRNRLTIRKGAKRASIVLVVA